MPFEIVRNDITNMQVDAIVNAANPKPIVGYGVDSGVHQKEGPQLLAARKEIGEIAFGDAAITPAFGLDAKYVIHTVSPVWQGGANNEIAMLESCYTRSLQLALQHGCESIAFPLLSAGNHGFPKDLALQTAVQAFSSFLLQHEMDVYLVVFDRSAVQLSEKLFADVQHYVDTYYMPEPRRRWEQESQWLSREEQATWMPENAYAAMAPDAEINSAAKKTISEKKARPTAKISRKGGFRPQSMPAPASLGTMPKEAIPERQTLKSAVPPKSQRSLQDLLARSHETFSEMLLRLIDEKGYTDVEVYKRANMDRKLFSKIRSNKDYHPKKATVFALAIALRLSVDEATDLLRKAGYTFSDSYKQDIIVRYFLERGEYDMFTINETLFCFEEPLLGA